MLFNYDKYEMQRLILPPMLSGFTVVLKILRVFILTRALSLNEYSYFITLLFLHGFMSTFEPSQSKGVIKLLRVNKKILINYVNIKNQIEIFFVLVSFICVLINIIISFRSESYSHTNMIFGTVFLVLSNYIYSQTLLKISILEYYGYFLFNRLYKLIFEILFVLILVLTLNITTGVSVVIIYLMCLFLILLLTNETIARFQITYQVDGNLTSAQFEKAFWQQIEMNLWVTLVLWTPIVVILFAGSENQITFYFLAAQLFQAATLVMAPYLAAIFPALVRDLNSHIKYFNISLVLLFLLGAFFLLLLVFIDEIIFVWTNDSVVVENTILVFLVSASFLELSHQKLRYFYSTKRSINSILKFYRILSIVNILIMCALAFAYDYLISSYISVLFSLVLINLFLLKKLMTITNSQKFFLVFILLLFIFITIAFELSSVGL